MRDCIGLLFNEMVNIAPDAVWNSRGSSAAWPGWNWRITWDAEGRLTQVGTNNGLSAAFTYHALRQRVGKVRQNPFGELRVRV